MIACAATLHQTGTSIDSATDAARALEPLAGSLASALFATGLLGAALLAASVLPLSTAYSVCEAVGAEAALDDAWRDARLFYVSFGAVIGVAAVDRADPRRAADPDPVPHAGAERRPAAAAAVVRPGIARTAS